MVSGKKTSITFDSLWPKLLGLVKPISTSKYSRQAQEDCLHYLDTPPPPLSSSCTPLDLPCQRFPHPRQNGFSQVCSLQRQRLQAHGAGSPPPICLNTQQALAATNRGELELSTMQ